MVPAIREPVVIRYHGRLYVDHRPAPIGFSIESLLARGWRPYVAVQRAKDALAFTSRVAALMFAAKYLNPGYEIVAFSQALEDSAC